MVKKLMLILTIIAIETHTCIVSNIIYSSLYLDDAGSTVCQYSFFFFLLDDVTKS